MSNQTILLAAGALLVFIFGVIVGAWTTQKPQEAPQKAPGVAQAPEVESGPVWRLDTLLRLGFSVHIRCRAYGPKAHYDVELDHRVPGLQRRQLSGSSLPQVIHGLYWDVTKRGGR